MGTPASPKWVDSFLGKRVAVIGIGVSNTPLIRLLLREGVSVTACDKLSRRELGALSRELEDMGAILQLGDEYLKDLNQDVIFRTPGMRPDHPAFLKAKAAGSVITSEMEVFFDACPCPIIAVTGSDGKTTTSTIIAKLLEGAGHTVYLGGNIGTPLLPQVGDMRPRDRVVLELSSFQLMTMKKSPQIGVVTNVTPNHLDYHGTMEEYVEAKRQCFLYQSAEDLLVLNFDNEMTRSFAKEAKGRVMFFGKEEAMGDGVILKEDTICLRQNDVITPVLQASEILLPGAHNVENYMAAIAAVQDLVPGDVIRSFAARFGGVEHRIELVRRHKGVTYYNDSIGTSPTRTIAGLRSFSQKVILIAGGYDKKLPFDALGEEIVSHVKILVLNGATAARIKKAVQDAQGYEKNAPVILDCPNFDAAVYAAAEVAEAGDVVLLSPACAAFDQFRNFAQRGEAFKEIVAKL